MDLEIINHTTNQVVYEHDEFRRYMGIGQVNGTTLSCHINGERNDETNWYYVS